MKSRIGITMDWQQSGSFSKLPHYAIRESYFKAVAAMGGVPIGIPLLAEGLEPFLEHVDGVIVPGGDYPSPKRWYDPNDTFVPDHPRAQMSDIMFKTILKYDIPLLGICAGMQELVAAMGGLLHLRVLETLPNAIHHRSVHPSELAHGIRLTAGSTLHRLIGQDSVDVNSDHNEGVRLMPESLRISATAPDGLVEAVEVVGHPFALGVQWHPEFLLTEADKALFRGFLDAATTYRESGALRRKCG